MFIHLDPRKPDVVVPPYFKKQPQLVLQVGLNMNIPIPDLKIDDEGVSCTLSFNRRLFWCRLPWTAIYALVGEAVEGEDMKGMLWPDDVPSEVAAQRDTKPTQQAPALRVRAAREPKRKAMGDRGGPAIGSSPPVSSPGRSSELARPAASVDPEAVPEAKRDRARPGKRELPPYLRVVK
jgi:stringent starvation protein B